MCSLRRVGSSLGLKRAHKPGRWLKSNPATMNDEELADGSAANPIALLRLHAGWFGVAPPATGTRTTGGKISKSRLRAVFVTVGGSVASASVDSPRSSHAGRSKDVLVDAVATRELSSPLRPAGVLEARNEVSPVPAGESAPGEVLPGVRDSVCSPVLELRGDASRGSQVLFSRCFGV